MPARFQLALPLLLLLCCRVSSGQPSITATSSTVVKYNDQYGPPSGASPGPYGCIGPAWNTAPCTGRWSYGDTFARTWDGTTSWMTHNDSAGGQTTEFWSGAQGGNALFRPLIFGTMSADNFEFVATNNLGQFNGGDVGACATNSSGGTATDNSWKSTGVIAYHGKLYWWLKCITFPTYHAFNATLLVSTTGMVDYTFKNHGTPGNAVPATADLIFSGGAEIVSPNWVQYADCPDNYGCYYTRPHNGDTYAYMLAGVGDNDTFSYHIPVRITWANLEADPFTAANYSYLTYTGTQTTCADGDVSGNWSTNLAALASTACHTTFGGGGQADIFYSNDLGAYIMTNWGQGGTGTEYNNVDLHVSSTPWFSASTTATYHVLDTPAYGTKFTAADLSTYRASVVGSTTTVTVDVTSSGNNAGVDFSASSNYSIAKRTLTLSATTGGSPSSSGKITRSGKTASLNATSGTSRGSGAAASAGATYTQYLLTYTAPSANPCTVEVSESPSYLPLVHDVDPTLFTDADQDDRTPNANVGTARVFVVGSQLPALALDAVTVYSRALQTYTRHYYRVTCDAAVLTSGSFFTANIPVGGTFNEPPPADPSSTTGGWLIPTLGTVRTKLINDPRTGAQLSPVSIPADHLGTASGTLGITTYDGAGIRACNEGLHVDGSGNSLYLCNLDDIVGKHALFSIYPATGVSNFLGQIQLNTLDSSNESVDDTLKSYNYLASTTTTTQFNYIGAYKIVTGVDGDGAGNPASFDAGTTYLTSSISQLMNAYDATFDDTVFSACAIFWTRSGSRYNLVVCRRGDQDSYGWLGIFDSDPGVKNIIAAWNTFAQPAAKFNGIHEYQIVYDSTPPLVEINWHTLNFDNTVVGTAEIGTTTVGSVSSGATSITVAGAITSRASGGDTACCPAIAVGDRFRIQGEGGTNFSVTGLPGGNVWNFTPAVNATVGNGMRVYMLGNGVASAVDNNTALTYWDFLADPHGTDTTGTTIIHDPTVSGGGHVTWGPLGRASEAYQITPRNGGSVLAALNTTAVSFDPTTAYNGVSVPAYGSLLVEHPAYQLTNSQPWFGDSVAFSGGTLGSPGTAGPSGNGGRWYSADVGAARVSGSLYQYFSDSPYPLNRKLIATLAINGGRSLRDISSPTTGDQIGTTSGDNYKYCVAYKVNECRTGSSAGDIFFNLPAPVTTLSAAITDVDATAITITSGTGIANGDYITIIAEGSNTSEIVKVISGGGTGSLTVERHKFDSPSSLHANGATVINLFMFCHGGDNATQWNDVCITDIPAYADTHMQFYFSNVSGADVKAKSRNITSGLHAPRVIKGGPMLKATPDGSYALFTIGDGLTVPASIDVWKVKMPILPPPDGVDRTAYIPTPIVVSAGAQNNTVVKFWYAEYGNAYCGTRAEACYAVAATVPAEPYKYPSDGSAGTLATVNGLSCSGGCTVMVPSISGKILYTQTILRDASNAILSTGSTVATAIP